MNNFGVIEIASTTTKTTPGWAYVPDTGPTPPQALQPPTNRKRAARNQPALSLSDLSAREETRVRKELEALDRDSHRDVNIPIPAKPGGGRPEKKHTPNVRRILQSQKTFANHLDDYIAMLALAESNPAAAAAMAGTGGKLSAASSANASKSGSPAPAANAGAGATQSKRAQAAAKRAAAKEKAEEEARKKAATAGGKRGSMVHVQFVEGKKEEGEDTPMLDADTPSTSIGEEKGEQKANSYPRLSTILPPYTKPPPPSHPGDDDPLLVSRVPPFPSDEELRELMTAPPLNYLEARGKFEEDEPRYPVRVFCGVCGYWGRVKCMKCGSRVCGLGCLEVHREECVTRYGL